MTIKTSIVISADAKQAKAQLTDLEAGFKRFRNVLGVGISIAAVSVALGKIKDQLAVLPRLGIEFRASIEQAELGMAGILSSMTTIKGRAVDLNQALGISRGIIRDLNDDALRTAASSEELVGAFQALLGPALAAKLSLQEIRQLTVTGVNAVKSLGLANNQVIQELRDLVTGGITSASSTLAVALGITNQDIERAKASSDGLFKFLMQRMEGFAAASDRFSDTFSGRLSGLQESATRAAADGFEPLFTAIKAGISELSDAFVKIERDGDKIKSITVNPEMVSRMREFSQVVVDAGGRIREGISFLYEHRQAVIALVTTYAGLKITGGLRDLVLTLAESAQKAYATAVASRAEGAARLEAARAAAVQADAVRILTAAQLADAQATVARATGMARLALVESTLLPAQLKAAQAAASAAHATEKYATAQQSAAVTSRLAGGALGLLGGPLGTIITLLGTAGTLWAAFGSNAAKAVDLAKLSADELEARLKKLNDQQRLGAAQPAAQALERAKADLVKLVNSPLPNDLELVQQAKRRQDIEEQARRVAALAREVELLSPPQVGSAPVSGLTPKFDATKDARDTSAAQLSLARERAEGELKLTKDALERIQDEAEVMLKRGLISLKDYFAQRQAVTEAGIRAEIEARQREIAQVQRTTAQAVDDKGRPDQGKRIEAQAKVLALTTEIELLERKLRVTGVDTARALEEANLDLSDALAEVKRELADLTGTGSEADVKAALQRRFRQLRSALQGNAEAFPGGEGLLNRYIDAKAAEESFGKVEQAFNATLARMRNTEQSLSTQREAGIINEATQRERLIELHRRTSGELDVLAQKMRAFAESVGSEELKNRVDAAVNEIERLKLTVDDVATAVNGALRDGFQGLFEDIARGGKSAKEIVLDFARTFEQAMTRLASQKLADQLFGGSGTGGAGGVVSGWLSGRRSASTPADLEDAAMGAAMRANGGGGGGGFLDVLSSIGSFFASFFHSGGIVGAGGSKRLVNPLAFLGAPRFHAGGIVGLGPTEVPTVLQRGEEVLRRDDPRHRMNGGGVTVQMTVNTPDANSFRHSRGQIEAQLASMVRRGSRLL